MESALSENGRGEWDYTQLRRRGSRGTGIKKWGVWLHCTPERTACQPENLGNRREKPGKSADLSGPPHHVLVGAQLRKAHGAPGVELLGGDAHLTAKAELSAVGEAGGAVDVDGGTVHCRSRIKSSLIPV